MTICCPTRRPTNNPRHKQRWTARYMPTVTVRTVKPSGGDYSSLSAAEAGEQGDLVTLDRQLDIECYSMNDTTAVTIAGWTTDATRYVRIFTPTAERHAGVWSTSKYRLVVAAAFTRCITNNEDYVRIEGIQVHNTDNTNGAGAIYIASTANSAASDIRITESLVKNSGRTVNLDGNIIVLTGLVTIRNSASYGAFGPGAMVGGFASAVCNVDNCTLTGNSTYGLQRSSDTMTIRNCYSGGNTTEDYSGTITKTTCAHSTATSFTGSTASIAYTTSNFTNVTAGSEDLHLVSGASATLLTGGTDLSGTFTTDIDGETRVDWGIGADEYISAVVGQIHKLMMMGCGI